MPDRSSAPPPDRALDDESTEPGPDAPRPARAARRRLVTPWTAGLCGLLLATTGFIAGVQVQKGQAGDTTATANGRGAGAPTRAGFGGAAAGGDAPTVGSVANKRGSTLYVEDADGTTVRVTTNAQSEVTRSATASVGAIHPGDTVVVQGTKDEDGTLVATRITATSKSAAAGGGGLRRAFGGGARAGGGAPSAGRAPRDEVTGGG